MLTLEDARLTVRVTSNKFDDELEAMIEAGALEMKTAGIARQEDDKLYDQALRMYVRGNFEPAAPEAEACREIFQRMKGEMKHVTEYREE